MGAFTEAMYVRAAAVPPFEGAQVVELWWLGPDDLEWHSESVWHFDNSEPVPAGSLIFPVGEYVNVAIAVNCTLDFEDCIASMPVFRGKFMDEPLPEPGGILGLVLGVALVVFLRKWRGLTR